MFLCKSGGLGPLCAGLHASRAFAPWAEKTRENSIKLDKTQQKHSKNTALACLGATRALENTAKACSGATWALESIVEACSGVTWVLENTAQTCSGVTWAR